MAEIPVQKSESAVEIYQSPYALFMYAIRSPVTRGCYLRRLRTFFDYIRLESEFEMEERCRTLVERSRIEENWLSFSIIRFLQYQKERVEKKEITGATVQKAQLAVGGKSQGLYR